MMIITTTYRGNKVEIVNSFHHVWAREHSVVLQQQFQNGKKQHTVEIQAGDLLKVAQVACKKLTEISGINFAVCCDSGSGYVKVKS